MIALIPDNEGGKKVLKDKVNEVIALLNNQNKPSHVEAAPVEHTIPVVYNGEEPKSFDYKGFTASPVPGYLNAPSGGFTDEAGVSLVGMLKLDRVPQDVRAAFHDFQLAE